MFDLNFNCMKTNNLLDLRSAQVLTKSELKQIKGGSGAFLCKCSPFGQEYSVGGSTIEEAEERMKVFCPEHLQAPTCERKPLA